MAREEGQVNIVQWPLYAQLVDEFTAATGCKVTLKDGDTLGRHDHLHGDGRVRRDRRLG